MKYLTTTFAIAFMAFGFASIMAAPAQARGDFYDVMHCEDKRNYNRETHRCEGAPTRSSEITDVEPLERFASNEDGYDRARQEADEIREDKNGNIIYEKDGRIVGLEIAGDVYDWKESLGEGQGTIQGWKTEEGRETAQADINASVCAMFPTIPDCNRKTEEAKGEQFAGGKRDWRLRTRKAEEAEGGQVACSGNDWIYGCKPTKTATGTFYPLPMIDVASMDKLLAPGGTSVASFDKILAPGGTAVESDYQFADREDGSGGDFGESGGGDFGEGDRAAASTAAE